MSKSINSLYLIGSLRNEEIRKLGKEIRDGTQIDVFDDWHGAGPHADDEWKAYEQARGRSYRDALRGYAARQIFNFDKTHLDRCDAALLCMPAGKSGHLELGYAVGSGKLGFILFEEGKDDRWDVMVQFATEVFFNKREMMEYFNERPS